MEAIPRRKEERIRTNKQLKKHLKFPDEKHHFSKTGQAWLQHKSLYESQVIFFSQY